MFLIHFTIPYAFIIAKLAKTWLISCFDDNKIKFKLMVIFKYDGQEDPLRTIKKRIYGAKKGFNRNKEKVCQIYN